MNNNIYNTETDTTTVKLSVLITTDYINQRLDKTLAQLFPDYSRENLKTWILDGSCLLNNLQVKPKYKIKGGELITINTKLINKNYKYLAENLPINIIFEDSDLLIIDKPCNLVVHPGAGHWKGTLLNRLLHHAPELKLIPRAGIVHRLDQDTTGLMIIAKTLAAYNNLIKQFKHKSITKIYEAIVIGDLIAGGVINAPINRDQFNRLKMRVAENGKPAITNYIVLKRFNKTPHKYTYIRVNIETGRTHQIRVHLKHIKHPILGDKLYNKTQGFNQIIKTFPRQALHAKELIFTHPITSQKLHFVSKLPEDLQNLLRLLEQYFY